MDEERVSKLIGFIYTSPENPTFDDFADIMGLQEVETADFANLDEIAKLLLMNHLLRKLRMPGRMTKGQQEFIYNKLAALYLPAMVNRFLEPSPLPTGSPADFVEDFKLNNVYIEVMGTISHTPYFAKYLNSDLPAAQGGKQLMRVVAERLVEVAPSWDPKMLNPPPGRAPGYFQMAAATSIQLLSTLLASFVEEPKDSPVHIPAELKTRLLIWLKNWKRRHSTEFLGRVCERTRSQLEGGREVMTEAKYMRHMLLNLDNCGKPGCRSKSHLKVCSKCKTVRYCSVDHQKAHWTDPREPHKNFCHATEY